MQYINPYELLNLSMISLSDIDSRTITREKKRLFQEIELNGRDLITFKGIEITKSQCVTAIDELDDKHKREFYFFIHQNKPLNDFLTNGNLSFFESHKVESIYKLPAFINFISPFFDQQYDKVLTNNFKAGNKENVIKILSINPITNTSFNENSYKNTYQLIKDVDSEINQIIKEIDNEESPYIDESFKGLDTLIKSRINIEILNLLPSYFQGIRNQLAQSIRNLARDINNEPFELYIPAYNIISIANLIDTDALVKQTITTGYNTIKGNYDIEIKKRESEKTKPYIDKYYSLIDEIIAKRNAVNNKVLSALSVNDWVNSKITISELNGLDSSAFEVRNLTALALKSLSVTIWNDLDDIDIAISVLARAITIKVDEDTKAKLVESKIQLDDLKAKIQRQKVAALQRANATPEKEKSSYGVLIGLGVIILIIYLISNSNSSSSSSSSPTNSYSNNSYNSTPAVVDTASSYVNSPPPSNNTYSTEPVYTKVAMQNGNFSNCSGVVPKYDKNISTKLIITTELTDVAVKIFDYETNRCIRFVFVNDGTTYSVKNIPEGKYYLKIAYGNDWQVKEGDPACKGRFTSHASYKKDYSIYDFNKIYKDDGRVSIPYYTLKLYRTYTTDNSESNSTGNSISETDFNNN